MSYFLVSLKKGCWNLLTSDARVHVVSIEMSKVLMDLVWKAYLKQDNQVLYSYNSAFHITVDAVDRLNIVLVYKYETEYHMSLSATGRQSIKNFFTLTSTPVFSIDDVDYRIRAMADVFNAV